MFSKKEGVDDLTLISSMSNDEITGQLKARLNRELIYTNIGDVLISVNPFKRLPIYGPEYVQMYSSATSYDTAPHIYALAQTAYSKMMQENSPQAVIISGESGAGKTECAKLILNYISAVSGTSNVSQKVKAAIESTNPLLESFGNAKTIRNDNSSRFGKYLEISFNEQGEPAGGQTLKFLLERSRVTYQAKGERNFHIFYQLVKGASHEMREAFGLGGVGDYYYLSQSGTNTVNGVDDAADFQEVLKAMTVIGINDNDQWRCFQVLAAILHIGNITFDGDPKGQVTNVDELRWAAYLLSVEEPRLEHMMTTRLMASPRGSMYESPQNGVQCYAMRDALSKTLYNRVFNWLVDKINDSMKPVGLGPSRSGGGGGSYMAPSNNNSAPMGGNRGGGGIPPPRAPPGRGGAAPPPPRTNGAAPPPPRGSAFSGNNNNNNNSNANRGASAPAITAAPHSRSIGVLDIYGFEIFSVNGYEQFCINYVNERLQQIFIDLTLKYEQKEYHDEEMKWKDISFFDNIVVVELIEGKQPPGIFRVLDDVCRTCHAVDSITADVKFMEKLAKTLNHPHLVQYDKQFVIKHYAGDVTYTVDGDASAFCFKNKDNLFLSIVVGMLTTSEPWIKDLFKDDKVDSKSGPPPTSGADIRQSAEMLIQRLSVCFGHYIRCIKPNETRSALSFESSNVKHQVTYLGLLENVRVKKAGYSYRHFFRNFIERFGPLCNDNYRPQYDKQGNIIPNNVNPNPLNTNGGKEACNQIIRKVCSTAPLVQDGFRITEDEFGLGKSKIFIKSPETLFSMAELLEQKLDPEGYKLKMQEFKKVEKLASKNKRKTDRGLGPKCIVM